MASMASMASERRAAAGATAVGLVVSTAAIGHPVAGSWPGLAVAVAVVHAGAMAVWLGGLAALLAGRSVRWPPSW